MVFSGDQSVVVPENAHDNDDFVSTAGWTQRRKADRYEARYEASVERRRIAEEDARARSIPKIDQPADQRDWRAVDWVMVGRGSGDGRFLDLLCMSGDEVCLEI